MGGHRGVILQAHFRSVAHAVTQRSDAAKRHSAAGRDPPRGRLPLGPGQSQASPVGRTGSRVFSRVGQSRTQAWSTSSTRLVSRFMGQGLVLPCLQKGSWTKWAGRDLFRHRRFVTRACQSSRCFSSHPGPIAWVGWCASG